MLGLQLKNVAMNEDLENLFLQAREIADAKERAAFLDKACAKAPELRQRLERMLADEARAEAFFAEEESEPMLADRTEVIPPVPPLAAGGMEGKIIGRYKLLQKLGEGGFGSVWMAEQTEPVRRKVALKIIKRGMDTLQVIARFEAERQALAMMDHPNIAKVLDAGTTDTGRPYFVMELVKGIPVIDFCNEWKLDTEQRLLLFAEICSAINHAHQKGIIHRDIKPSNVLVTLHGDRPVPMVIDFGIAKATEAKLTDKTLFTRYDQFIGTPAYMSPEQVGLSGLDIDTRSDIYSLGVLLYELLVGSPPFDPKTLISAGFDEMRRIIREVDPPRPSLRISTAAREESARIREQLGTHPQRLGRLLKGELDWIVMKALEKDRTRRYETANALADDVKRYLSNELVQARPPSKFYEFQKSVRRHKFGFAATAAIILALAVGGTLATWQAVEARKAQGEAETARGEELVQRVAAEEARTAAESEKARAELEKARAEVERARAEAGERLAEDRLYAAQMNLAQQAWEQGDLNQLKRLLKETAAYADRGFEWYYWQRQLHREKFSLPGKFSFFSEDGKSILTSSGEDMVLQDAATGEVLKYSLPPPLSQLGQFKQQEMIAGCISADGLRLGTLGKDGVFRIFETASGSELHSWPNETARDEALGSEVWGMALSPDYRWMLISTYAVGTNGVTSNQLTQVWDVEQRQLLYTCSGLIVGLPGLGLFTPFSAEGQCFALTSDNDGYKVKLLESDNGRERTDFETKGMYGFTCVAFSPDGRKIVAGGYENGLGAIRTWAAASGNTLLTWPAHRGTILSVAFSQDGRQIASGDDFGTVRIWDASNGRELLTLQVSDEWVIGVKFSADGRHLLAGGKAWDLALGQGPVSLPIPTNEIPVGSNGKFVLTLGGTPITVSVCDASSGRELHRFPVQVGEYPLTISSDGTRVAITSQEAQVVKVVDVQTGKTLTTLTETGDRLAHLIDKSDGVVSANFTPDGSKIITSYRSLSMKFWDATSGQAIATVDSGFGNYVAISSDGQRIVTTGRNGRTITVWDANTFEIQNKFEWPGRDLVGIALFPDGRRIIVGGWGGAKVLDAKSGQELLRLESQEYAVNSVSVSPDGRQVITIGNSAKVWEAATPRQVVDWEAQEHGWPSHPPAATSVIDDRIAYDAMRFATLRLWLGEDAAYVATRREMLAVATSTNQPAAAERIARLAALRPIPEGPLREAALAYARSAVADGRTNAALPWYQLALGMVEYRCQDFQAADLALQDAGQVSQSTFRPDLLLPTVGFYRAMSLWQQGKRSQAGQLFNQTKSTMPPLPVTLDQTPLDDGACHDYLTLWLAYKEVEAMLREPSTDKP